MACCGSKKDFEELRPEKPHNSGHGTRYYDKPRSGGMFAKTSSSPSWRGVNMPGDMDGDRSENAQAFPALVSGRLKTAITWYNVGMKKVIDFGAGKWDSSLWMNVKSSRLDYVIQAEDHVVNPCPDVSDEELWGSAG